MQDALLYQPNMPPTTRNCNPLPRSQHEVQRLFLKAHEIFVQGYKFW